GEAPEKPEAFALTWDEKQGYQLKFGKHALGVRRHQNELVVAVDGKMPDSAAAKALEGQPEAAEEPDEPVRSAPTSGKGAPPGASVTPGNAPAPTGAGKSGPAGAKPAAGGAVKPTAPAPQSAPANTPATPAKAP